MIRSIAVIVTAAVILAGCGDKKPDPIPATSTSPAAKVSPAPKSPKLSTDQHTAYKDALADHLVASDVIGDLQKDLAKAYGPNNDWAPAKQDLARVTGKGSPMYKYELDQLMGFHKDKITITGDHVTHWRVPVEVVFGKASDPRSTFVRWRACQSVGDVKVTKAGKPVKLDWPKTGGVVWEYTDYLVGVNKATTDPIWLWQEQGKVGSC